MPFCPRCHAQYQNGFNECLDCGATLVPVLLHVAPWEPRPEPVEEVRLARYPSQTEAEMWAELLRGEGIPTVLVPLGLGVYVGVGVPYEIRVRASDADRARQLLADITDQ